MSGLHDLLLRFNKDTNQHQAAAAATAVQLDSLTALC